ncbi:DUF4157 domain-containing protein [Floridanema flaviceps]
MRSQIQKKATSSSYSPPAQKATSWQRPFSDPVHDPKQDGTLQSKIAPGAGFNLLQMKLFPDTPIPVQAKLSVGAPGDKYEQEADSMANKVMTMPAPENEEPIQREALPEEKKEEEVQTKPLAATITPLVQRETAPEEPKKEEKVQAKALSNPSIQRESAPEEPKEEEEVQTKALSNPSIQRETTTEEPKKEEDLPVQAKAESEGKSSHKSNLESQLNGSKGGGSPLPDEVRAFMEPRFGADFSGVRVHTDGAAVQMNKELGAQAFAHGSDIYYSAGKSPSKDELTAHELTHVVQQTGAVQQKVSENKPIGHFTSIEIQTKPSSNFVQCKIIKIGTEKVNVANNQEELKAKLIIKTIKDKYGIDISSQSGVDAIKNDYPNAPDDVKNGLQTKVWQFKELIALEQALMHFAPILGTRRKASSRASKAQEITSVSKVDQAIDADDPSGVLDNTTLGEYFESSKNFSMFSAGTNSTVDFKDNNKQLKGTAIHEIAHGLLKYALNDYVKALDYWIDEDTKSGKSGAEAPITKYGETNANEDLSEAVMYYFVEAKTLRTKCPKRYAFIRELVRSWTKKKNNP